MKSKEAQAKAYKKYYLKNKEAMIARAKTYTLANRIKIRQYINTEKSKPCTDCKLTYPPYVMDFDHIGGTKLFNIANSVSNSISIKKIIDEIAKCELVCSNCHRIRTWNRKYEKNT